MYKRLYQLTTDSQKLFINFVLQRPSNLGLARIAEQGVPHLYSRFREESWYHSRVIMRSDKTRTRLLFAGLRSCNFLVKESFPLLKTMANVYQSLQEAFYQSAKVPHSVYSSINVIRACFRILPVNNTKVLVDNWQVTLPNYSLARYSPRYNRSQTNCWPIKPLSHGPKNAGQIRVESAFDQDVHLSHARVDPGYNLGQTLLPSMDRIRIKDGGMKGR